MSVARTLLARAVSSVSAFLRDRRGSIALKFAFLGPAIIMLAVGAVDLTAVHAAKAKLQDIPDAGALAGAPALALATDGASAKERAESFVAASLSEWVDAPTVTGTYEIVQQGGQRAIRVLLNGHRPSFFANMLPPGGWKFIGDATATSVGIVPLCVLVTGDSGSKLLNVKDAGRIAAPACLIHSNRDIQVDGGSISASMVQAVTSATGVISPAPGNGAARIADPFAGINLDEEQPCDPVKKADVKTGVIRLPPGIHCGGFTMAGDSELILESGEHWFLGGHLVIKEDAKLTGVDVVLFFNKDSKFEFKDRAMVNLDGRKSGLYAGMVMIATRGNSQDFIISSDNVESLLGVIYVPEALLIVEGKADVARDSAWTVIVAKSLQLKGSPSLYVNANYNTTDVPVPNGVGPRTGGSRLIQ